MNGSTPLSRLGGRNKNVRWIKCRAGTIRIERADNGYDVSASRLGQRRVSAADLEFYIDELAKQLDGRLYSESLTKHIIESLR